MATYVISDIHGMYHKFEELIEIIELQETDTVYILGDILDRGEHPIRTVLRLMEMPQVICIAGNHETMAIECLKFLNKEITDQSLEEIDDQMLDKLITWKYNGGDTTIREFRALDSDMRKEVIEFLEEFELYDELILNGLHYLLVHSGLGNFSPDKEMDEYTLKELVWDRPNYNRKYFEDILLVTGHTPTQLIDENNENPGYIYKKNNHIAIDCGASFPGGRLAAICLETGEEFYSSDNMEESE